MPVALRITYRQSCERHPGLSVDVWIQCSRGSQIRGTSAHLVALLEFWSSIVIKCMCVSTVQFHYIMERGTCLRWNAEVVQFSTLHCEQLDELVLVCLSWEEKPKDKLLCGFISFFFLSFFSFLISDEVRGSLDKSTNLMYCKTSEPGGSWAAYKWPVVELRTKRGKQWILSALFDHTFLPLSCYLLSQNLQSHLWHLSSLSSISITLDWNLMVMFDRNGQWVQP